MDLSAWQLIVGEADFALPTAEQQLPPVNLVGTIQQLVAVEGAKPQAEGRFSIRTQGIEGAVPSGNSIPPMQMTIATMACRWNGTASSIVASQRSDRKNQRASHRTSRHRHANPRDIRAQIATAQIDNLALTARQIVGDQGAALKQVRLSGKVNMIEDRLTAENAILESDIGALGVAASMPTTLPLLRPATPDRQRAMEYPG